MAIQSRRGNIANFDKGKMLPGEFGVALDSQEAFICFGAGVTKKMATDEDYADMIEESVTATENAKQATVNANTAVADFRALEVTKLAINDAVKSTASGWSSNKTSSELDTAKATINTSLANQIGTASGASINLPNTYNGGLLLKELQGKSVQSGTPTPEAKVDIVSVGDNGSVVARVCGKNVLPRTAKTATTINGITFTPNSDGSISVTGTATVDTEYVVSSSMFIPIGNYMLSGCPSGGSRNTYRAWLNSNSKPSTLWFDDIGASAKCSISEVLSDFRYVIKVYSGVTINQIFKPQLELGSTSTTYEQYKEQLVTIPLTQPLRSVGSVYDRGCIKNSYLWGNERKFAVEIFDGSADEKWSVTTTDTASVYRAMSTKIKSLVKKASNYSSVPNLMCNRYSSASLDATYIKRTGISINTDGSLMIYDDAYSTGDISLFTANLAAKPLTVVYELAIPTWEPYSQSLQDILNKLQSNTGVTNVFTTDPQQPVIVFSYGKTDTAALSLYANNIYDSKVDKSKVTKSLAVTESGFIADAEAIKTINDKADANTKAIGEVNNNLTWTICGLYDTGVHSVDLSNKREILAVLFDTVNGNTSRASAIFPIEYFTGGNAAEVNTYIDQRNYGMFTATSSSITVHVINGTYVNRLLIYAR